MQRRTAIFYREDLVNFLRFTRAEYGLISSAFRSGRFPMHDPAAFRRRLAGALTAGAPKLAWRVALLGDPEVCLLCDFLRDREAPRSGRKRPKARSLTPAEWVTFAEACASHPLPNRFRRAWKAIVLETLWDLAPKLARKLDRLRDSDFEELVAQAVHDRGQD